MITEGSIVITEGSVVITEGSVVIIDGSVVITEGSVVYAGALTRPLAELQQGCSRPHSSAWPKQKAPASLTP